MIIWGSTTIRYNTWGMRFNAAKCHGTATLNFSTTHWQDTYWRTSWTLSTLEKLKQTAYISLICSSMEYGATVWDPYQKYNSDKDERVQRQAARFVKSWYSRYSSVSDVLGVDTSFSKETGGSTYSVLLQNY